MQTTFVTFYKLASWKNAPLRSTANYLFQWIYQGYKPTYTHVGVKIVKGDTAIYYALCWDGLDVHIKSDVKKYVAIDELWYPFDVGYLNYFTNMIRRTGYKLLLMDLVKAFFHQRTKQYLCTTFVLDVIYKEDMFVDEQPGFKVITPDELYEVLKSTDPYLSRH